MHVESINRGLEVLFRTTKLNLFVELNVLQNFDGLVIISEQRVKPQEPHQAEVTQHLVQGVATIFSSYTLWISWNSKEHIRCLVTQGLTQVTELQLHRIRHLQRT